MLLFFISSISCIKANAVDLENPFNLETISCLRKSETIFSSPSPWRNHQESTKNPAKTARVVIYNSIEAFHKIKKSVLPLLG